jgi:hypothetical protein
MFATQTLTISVPMELVREFLSPVGENGFVPKMVLTDPVISAAVIRALIVQAHDGADEITKTYRLMTELDSTVDSIAMLKELTENSLYTLSALFLALTNAQM